MWTDWSAFPTCSSTCMGGTQTRTRTCTNPAPMFGGMDCTGAASETQSCNDLINCPGKTFYKYCNKITLTNYIWFPSSVDGMWTNWSTFSTCSSTCMGGTQTRTRTCTNPAPMFGGMPCTGVASETQSCNDMVNCPGEKTQWLSWSEYMQCRYDIAFLFQSNTMHWSLNLALFLFQKGIRGFKPFLMVQCI